MNSQELLKLVKNCPKGAETLVTRCLHSLTDKGSRNFCRAICRGLSSSSGDAWPLLGRSTQVVWAPEPLKATRFSLRSSSIARAGEASSRSLQQKAPRRQIPYPCPQRLGKGAFWVLSGGVFKVPFSLLLPGSHNLLLPWPFPTAHARLATQERQLQLVLNLPRFA